VSSFLNQIVGKLTITSYIGLKYFTELDHCKENKTEAELERVLV